MSVYAIVECSNGDWDIMTDKGEMMATLPSLYLALECLKKTIGWHGVIDIISGQYRVTNAIRTGVMA